MTILKGCSAIRSSLLVVPAPVGRVVAVVGLLAFAWVLTVLSLSYGLCRGRFSVIYIGLCGTGHDGMIGDGTPGGRVSRRYVSSYPSPIVQM